MPWKSINVVTSGAFRDLTGGREFDREILNTVLNKNGKNSKRSGCMMPRFHTTLI